MQINVLQWLEKTAFAMPEQVALVDEEGQLSYQELRKRSLAIAREIIARRVNADRRIPVCVYMKKGAKVIASFFGIAYSGGFYSPIDVEMPAIRANRILETLAPEIVITTREHYASFCELAFQGDIIVYDDIAESEKDEEIVLAETEKIIDTDLLYVLFTSGSTGTPKGVSIRHRAVIDYIDWVTEEFSVGAEDRFGNQAPFYFDNSILDIYASVKTGATNYIIPQNLFHQPVRLLEYLRDNRISTIFWVPSALTVVSRMRALEEVELEGTLKRVLFCGEVMPTKQLNIWRKALPDIVYANLYGPTEITDACTFFRVERNFADDEPLPIGKPIRNTDILVLNEKDQLVSKNEIGELCVRGTSLAAGYHNNPERTRAAFVQNPLNTTVPEVIYRTGDLVRYNEYGEIMYLSRKDFQIKHLGHRIELGEIETAVSATPEVSMCCCLYDSERARIVLFIDAPLDKTTIWERLREQIPEYMLPGKVVVLEKMPINANGKIDRQQLAERL